MKKMEIMGLVVTKKALLCGAYIAIVLIYFAFSHPANERLKAAGCRYSPPIEEAVVTLLSPILIPTVGILVVLGLTEDIHCQGKRKS